MGTTRINGVSYFSEAVKETMVGDELELVHDAENKYDPNAMKVINKRLNLQIGFVPKEFNNPRTGQKDAFSAEVKRKISGGRQYSAKIIQILGGTPEKPSLGLKMNIGWESTPQGPRNA